MRFLSVICFMCVLLHFSAVTNGGFTCPFIRTSSSVDMSESAFPPPPGFNAPEQVHITQGDHEGRSMIISWVTPLHKSPKHITYWEAEGRHRHKSHKSQAVVTMYRYYNYTSGYIHHATTRKLKFNTRYIYEIGHQDASRRFSFTTPPRPGPDIPYTFGLMGDLGQTEDSNRTLEHYMSDTKGQTVLYVGDYHMQTIIPSMTTPDGMFGLDSLRRALLISPGFGLQATTKLIWPQRLRKTRRSSHLCTGSTLHIELPEAPLLFFTRSSAGQPTLLSRHRTLLLLNRSETPWLIVLVHSPWYNSNGYHYMEGEGMRVTFESALVKHKVDIVFAGHVHAYERSHRISNVRYNITNGLSTPVGDASAPVYITIGDGGNIEGLANEYTYPQPAYSAFREASFGHALLEIKNKTHAFYTWHRNQDSELTVSDCAWFYNRYWYPRAEPACDPKMV